MSRASLYHEFKKYAQEKDTRTMDEICANPNAGFEMQVQQKLMKDLMSPSKKWDKLLLYHGIGSGKTCTSITMAEEWLSQNPTNKVTVILPARLKTNFLDELISPCGLERYISKEDFVTYNSSDTSASTKKSIRTKFMKKINDSYEIVSFERFQLLAKKSDDIVEWIKEFTKDRLIIIDEIHNLINTNYKPESYDSLVNTHKLPMKASGVRTMLFRYFVANADVSCKMLLMTATPIFDNVKQFRELTSIMSGVPAKEIVTLRNAIELLRGMVSYFPGTSKSAYPAITYINDDIELTKTQSDVFSKIQGIGDDDDKEKESFLSKQRQASIACLPNNAKITPKNIGMILSKPAEYAPKIQKIVKYIEGAKLGKHLVFSNYVEKGLHILEALLRKKGWVSYNDVLADPELAKKHNYKVFAVWDGELKDVQKQATKNTVNSKSNIDGKLIKVVLGSPSVKEGVSFKHIQHLHMLDPVWNNSAKIQVEGRAVRFCSHIDIPVNDPVLKRSVDIHLYKIISKEGGDIKQTADEKIYDEVIPLKKKTVDIAEKALKHVAIDYYLFRKMHEEKDTYTSPLAPINSDKSMIDIPDDEDINLNKGAAGNKVQASSCPKPRRPDDDGNCPEGMVLKNNKQGDACCYKVGRTKVDKAAKAEEKRAKKEAKEAEKQAKKDAKAAKKRGE